MDRVSCHFCMAHHSTFFFFPMFCSSTALGTDFSMCVSRAGLRGGPARQLLGVPKNFSKYLCYPQFRYMPSKRFTNPVLGQKCLKYISLKGHQIICLSKVPPYFGPDLDVSLKTQYMLLTSVTHFVKESHSSTSLLLHASTAGDVLLIELNL